jgi:prolyl-tRNA editing enzyme YbaK/EbsC (Cys-tRNA(Pro) deacylase)/nitrite reductase/ring-hydroxylating ferredoxin subunit
MTLVGDHLAERGVAFEAISHARTDTTLNEARALGVAADAVLKTVVLKTAAGHALAVVPANRRLDMKLARQATADSHVRLATEAELRENFADYELAAVPPLGELLGVPLFVDPEVMGHDKVVFAAGSQTESVVVATTDLFAGEDPTVVPLSTHEEDESVDPNGAPPTGAPVGLASDLPPGTVTGAGGWAVGNAAGNLFAVSRRCRHLGADLAGGSIDDDGCLVCPWHEAKYDVDTGRMVRGPQGAFAKIPGLDRAYRTLTRLVPLRRGNVEEHEGTLYVRG